MGKDRDGGLMRGEMSEEAGTAGSEAKKDVDSRLDIVRYCICIFARLFCCVMLLLVSEHWK
jgi:hypothetical protein